MKVFLLIVFCFTGISTSYSSPRTIGNYMLFAGGSLSSIAVHEAGHATALLLVGGKIEKIELFNDGLLSGKLSWKMDNPSRAKIKFMTASGLLSTSMLSEAIIQYKPVHGNAFAQGVLMFSLLSNVSHVKDYYFKKVGVKGWKGNDIDKIEAQGGNPHIFSALLLSYTSWALYRIYKDTDIFPLFSINLSF